MSSNVVSRPTSLACRECRRKHLKCDGGRPICTRCDREGLVCEYSPSRRGYGRRGEQVGRGAATTQAHVQHMSHPPTPGSSNSARTSRAFPELAPASTGNFTPSPDVRNTGQTWCSPPVVSAWSGSDAIDKELLINAYYVHFHPAHPLLVPRSFYERQHYPVQLERVVCFIGRYYVARLPDHDAMEAEVKDLSALSGIEATVPSVQALVLCAIVLHSLCYSDQALMCIRRAGVVAEELRLNHTDLDTSGVALRSVEAESTRRTWWELYTVDSYFAALHRRPSFACDPEDACPLLPGSTGLYNACMQDHSPLPLTSFERRFFTPEPVTKLYSSYCYRIEAIQILRRVLCVSSKYDTSTDAVEAVDNAIAAWKHYLPANGANLTTGEPSEAEPLFFQAHFFIHTASILLHFPRSELPQKVPSAQDISCIRNWTRSVPTCSQHTMKAIAASKDIANLAAIPISVDFYSPFFTCALIIACIVQLAASSMHISSHNDDGLLRHRDRVVLLLGALSQIGQKWKMASHGAGLLRRIADRIFTQSNKDSRFEVNGLLQQDVNWGNEDLWNNISWFDLFAAGDLQGDVGTTWPDLTEP